MEDLLFQKCDPLFYYGDEMMDAFIVPLELSRNFTFELREDYLSTWT